MTCRNRYLWSLHASTTRRHLWSFCRFAKRVLHVRTYVWVLCLPCRVGGGTLLSGLGHSYHDFGYRRKGGSGCCPNPCHSAALVPQQSLQLFCGLRVETLRSRFRSLPQVSGLRAAPLLLTSRCRSMPQKLVSELMQERPKRIKQLFIEGAIEKDEFDRLMCEV